VLDRASSFKGDEVVRLLARGYVPVALDVYYHERRKDREGALYRKIVQQRPNLRPGRTTQGFYIARPDGQLIQGWNNRNPDLLLKRLRMEAKRYEVNGARAPQGGTPDTAFARPVPAGALVADVRARILGSPWEDKPDPWDRILRAAVSRDHLWITAAEKQALLESRWPQTLTHRIARFHLIDNTRGEAPMWRSEDIRVAEVQVETGQDTMTVQGRVTLRTKDDRRWYEASLLGFVRADGEQLRRFDLVFRGQFYGQGRWTPGAPKRPFTLAVAFSLADPDAASTSVPPQAARSLHSYLNTR